MAPITARRPPRDGTTNQLLDCPNEVIHKIVEATTSPQEKLALCRVNSRLRNQSQQYLYKHIDLTQGYRYRRTQRCPRIILLIGTLLRRPDLALEVCHLLLGNSADDFLNNDLSPSTRDLLDKKVGSRWETVLQEVPTSPPSRECEFDILPSVWFCDRRAEAFAELLLLLVPRLSHLTLAFNFSKQATSLVDRILQNGATLSQLQHISVGSANAFPHQDGDNLELVLALMKVPKLENITTSFRFPQLSNWSLHPSHVFHSTTTLTTLNLGGITDEVQLQLILKRTPGLKILRWTPDDRGFSPGDDQRAQPTMQLGTIAGALQHVAATLTMLTIDTSPYHRPRYAGQFGNLWAKMHHLEELTIPAALLEPGILHYYHHHHHHLPLPTSLRHLTLIDGEDPRKEIWIDNELTNLNLEFRRTRDHYVYLQQIEDFCQSQIGYAVASFWLQGWKALTPNLRSIELDIATHAENHHSVVMGGSLLKLGATADLEVRVNELRSNTSDADIGVYSSSVKGFREYMEAIEVVSQRVREYMEAIEADHAQVLSHFTIEADHAQILSHFTSLPDPDSE